MIKNYQIYHSDLPDEIKLYGDIAIDCETTGLNFVQRDRLCLIQICDAKGNVYIIRFNKIYDKAHNLAKVLADASVQKIFHYARFDVGVIKHYLKIDTKNIFCTKIASKLARTYTMHHSLKELCKELLKVQISKQMQCSYWGKTLEKEQIQYAINDVIYLHRIKHHLVEMLKNEDRLDLAYELFSFLPTHIKLDILGYKDIFSHDTKST